MNKGNYAPNINTTDLKHFDRSKHLIKHGNLVILPQHPEPVNKFSGYLIQKKQLEQPVLVKIYYSLGDKYLPLDNFCLRLELLKIHHAIYRNDPFALYIDKSNLELLTQTVKSQSSNTWTVVPV